MAERGMRAAAVRQPSCVCCLLSWQQQASLRFAISSLRSSASAPRQRRMSRAESTRHLHDSRAGGVHERAAAAAAVCRCSASFERAIGRRATQLHSTPSADDKSHLLPRHFRRLCVSRSSTVAHIPPSLSFSLVVRRCDVGFASEVGLSVGGSRHPPTVQRR